MTEKIPRHAKPEVPQVNSEYGISKDFVNQFAYLISLYDFGQLPVVISHLKDRPFKAKKYADVYANFQNVVNDKNREAVARLDSLMTHLEDILRDPDNINEDDFRQTVNDAYFMVYGNNAVKI